MITIRKWEKQDLPHLYQYLVHLGSITKSRFGPHPFDQGILEQLFDQGDHIGMLVIDNPSTYIIGYALIKQGFLTHDAERLKSYGLQLSHTTDATYAPSLADEWQGKGIGKLIWQSTIALLQQKGIRRVILWGGVQQANERAVAYYHRLGFVTLGTFSLNSLQNLDMICSI